VERALKVHLLNGKFKGTSLQRSKAMRAVRGMENRTTERRLRFGLVQAGVQGWKVRPKGLDGSPDFFFAARKLAVFVDGCFWHGCPRCGHLPRANSAFWKAKIERNRARDERACSRLKEQGINVLRFWEHDLSNKLDKCIKRIKGQGRDI
jgi:DNA mismatch endonuclease, patch repair protein